MEQYLGKEMPHVYSLVASMPYSPVDVDLGTLARGEWNASSDRFRVWFLPEGMGGGARSCYVMIRKYDKDQGVIAIVHLTMNLEAGPDESNLFTVGILSNDNVRARAMLGVFLSIPPCFHKRSEVKLIEKRWRRDPETVARYAANVYSALSAAANPGGTTYKLEFEAPVDVLKEIRPDMDEWWEDVHEDEDGDHKA